MIVNMQLSSLLSRCKLGLRLKWRPREENTIADALTNKDFSSVDQSKRLPLSYAELPLSLLRRLWDTHAQFAEMKTAAKSLQSKGHFNKRRKHDKTPW